MPVRSVQVLVARSKLNRSFRKPAEPARKSTKSNTKQQTNTNSNQSIANRGRNEIEIEAVRDRR